MNQPRPSNRERRFTTEAQAEFRRGGRRRLLWAGAVALVGLILIVLLGPGEQTIKDKFEYYGAPDDEMRIMPEISIDEGSDAMAQVPKSLQVPPPPANLDIIEEEEDPDAEEVKPENPSDVPNEIETPTDQPNPDAEVSSDQQVELALPTQTSKDWYILHMVRPEYPLDATEAERRTRVIFVNLWIFVEPDGSVSTAWVTSTNGGRAFSEAVITAVKQWKVGWRIEVEKGRQIQMTWRFKSPYFIPGAPGG